MPNTRLCGIKFCWIIFSTQRSLSCRSYLPLPKQTTNVKIKTNKKITFENFFFFVFFFHLNYFPSKMTDWLNVISFFVFLIIFKSQKKYLKTYFLQWSKNKNEFIKLSSRKKRNGGAGYRSPYLSHAKRALYHLSYTPS
jgi:hypothetical protein